MTTNPDWLTTNRTAPSRQSGGVLSSFLMTSLGLAVLMPALLLQGVATRSRPDDVELDEAPPMPLVPKPAETVQATNSGANNGVGAAAPQAEAERQTDEAGNLPGLGNGREGARVNRNGKPRPERPELSQAERIARRRERLEQKAAAGDVRPAGPRATASPEADAVAATEMNSSSTALATVAPATVAAGQSPESAVATEGAPGDTGAAELVPAGPVTFEEIQAAFQESATAFRDVKRSLNSAYTLIGRLNVERYQAQYELAELKGMPLPERPPDRSWQSAAKPVAPPEAKRVKKSRRDEDELDRVAEEEVKAIAKRRQQMVIIGLAILGAFIIFYRISGWGWFPDLTDRQAMTQIAGLGILMQAFFLIFFLFRLGTMTGRGKSWLFPTAEQEEFKRRRKRMRGH